MKMPNPTQFLSGYRTYIVSTLVVLIGIAEGLLGLDIPGVTVGDNWLNYILVGTGFSSLRAAVNKAIEAVTGN
ncbi:MAG: hypothetical protein D6773_04245 [Alphaproteobacteria bacterium]|nr:MAG: hypothetical protein D6773_04245 [Alphaproteobacteria bacterium]